MRCVLGILGTLTLSVGVDARHTRPLAWRIFTCSIRASSAVSTKGRRRRLVLLSRAKLPLLSSGYRWRVGWRGATPRYALCRSLKRVSSFQSVLVYDVV